MDGNYNLVESGQLKWNEFNTFSKALDRLDSALVRIRCSHDDNVSSANGKVQKLTRRENLLADGLISAFIDKWNSKNRECKTVKQALKTTANDRARLREKCNDLEDHVTRLQRQFSQAIDLSVDEIQALSTCNNSFKSKIQTLEENYNRSEQSVTETVTRGIEYLKTIKGKFVSDQNGKLNDELSIEISNLQRVLALNREFQSSSNGLNNRSNSNQTQLKDERNATQLILKNELKDARDLIEKQKKYIKELEVSVEDSSEFAIEDVLEERNDERDIFQHLKQSILVQLQQGENSSTYDDSQMSDDVSQEIESTKKIAETLRNNLSNIRKELMKKDDDIIELKNSLTETEGKVKNTTSNVKALSEERDFIKAKAQQLENRFTAAQDELQVSQNRIRESENQISTLKNEIDLLRDGKEDYRSYCDKLTGQQDLLIEEVAKLKQDRDANYKEKTAEAAKKEQLKTENDYLTDEIAALKLATKKFEQKKECYEEEIDRLLSENEELKLTGQGADDEKRKQKEKLRELNIAVKDLEDQSYQATNENKRLEGEVRRITKQYEQIEKQLEESMTDYNDLSILRDKLEEQLKHSRLGESKEVELSQEIQTKLKTAINETKEKDEKLNNTNQKILRFIHEANELMEISIENNCEKTLTPLQKLSGTLPAVKELKKVNRDNERLILQIKAVIPNANEDSANLDILRSVTDLVEKSEATQKNLERIKEKSEADCSTKDAECHVLEQKLKEKSNELRKKKNSENALQCKIGYLRQQIKRNGSRFRRFSYTLTSESAKLRQDLEAERLKCGDNVIKAFEEIQLNLDALNSHLVKSKDIASTPKKDKENDLMTFTTLHSKSVCNLAISTLRDFENQSKTHKEEITTEQEEKEKYRMRIEDMKLLIEASEKKFSALDKKIETVKKFSTAVNQKLLIIHDGLSCVTMCNKDQDEDENHRDSSFELETDGAEDMLSVVRDTYKSNRKSFQAAVTVLESIKATYEVEDFDIEESGLSEGIGEEIEIGPLLTDLNSNINVLLKDTRSFLASPSFQSLQAESIKESQHPKHKPHNRLTNDQCVEHKKQIARLEGELKEKDTRLRSTIALKDKLANEAMEKDNQIKRLNEEQSAQTTAVLQLEKDLELLRIEYRHISKNLIEKEATLADMRDCILNEIVEQRKSKQQHHQSQIVSRQAKNVDMERIKKSLDEIKSVNDGYSDKIEDLHGKVESFLKVFLDNSKKREKPKKSDLPRHSRSSSISEIHRNHIKERVKEDSPLKTEMTVNSENQLRLLLNSKEQENSYLQKVVREMKTEISSLQTGIIPATETLVGNPVNPPMLRNIHPGTNAIDGPVPSAYNTNYQPVMTNGTSYPYDIHTEPTDVIIANDVSSRETQPMYGYNSPHQLDYYHQQLPLQQMPGPYYRPEQGTPDDGCYMTCTMSESSVLPYSDDDCPYCDTCEESDPYFYSEEEWDKPYMSLADCSNVSSRQAKRVSLIEGISTPPSVMSTPPMKTGRKQNLQASIDKSSERSFPLCSTPSNMSSRGNDSDFEPFQEKIDTNQFPYNFGDRSNPTSPRENSIDEESYKKKKNRKHPRRLSIPFPFASRKNKTK